MIRNIFVFILIILLQSSVLAQTQTRELNSNWTFHKKGESNSYAAKVPGSIYTDLYRNQLIPDPYFGENEKQLQWIEHDKWIYECSFSVSKEELQSQNIRLKFNGIDTYSNVYLNDSLILQTQSMFLAYHKDINELLKANNKLRIEILPPLSQIPKEDSINYSGGPQAHVRKAAFQFGWDWAPRYAAGGIWKKVSLAFHYNVQIDDVTFQLMKLDKNIAQYLVLMDYDYEQIENYDLIISCKEAGILENYHFGSPTEYYLTPFSIDIPNPKLWHPTGMGEAYLYNFNIRIEQNGKILNQVNQKIGIREIELVNEADSMGTSFYFKVNGKPIYIKGANYVPQDVFVGNKKNPHQIIHDIVNSNMNMIRIWGGGIYESDEFYDLCDSAGIMIWQDFMFANSVYPSDSNFLSLVKQEANQQVKRLQNHPCIALWCGNNEISEAWHNWGWQKQFGYSPADSTRLWNNYHNIFDTILPIAVDHLSNGTPYWQSSPQYGRGNPLSKNNGDFHYWGVWHDGHSFDSLENNTGRFMSEFGFQSYPSLSTIEKICDDEDFGIESSQLQNHQKHSRGNAIIQKYMMDEYGIVPEEFDDFVYLSQILQSDGIAKGLKAQRRNQPFCMGSMYWQLNDAWPAISWSGIDYYGNWKPLQYAVRNAYKQIIISHTIANDTCTIYTISDATKDFEEMLHIQVMDFYGNISFSNKQKITVSGQQSQIQYKLNTLNIDPKKEFILVELISSDWVADRELIFLGKPHDLDLPKAEFEIKQISLNGELSIYLTAKTFVKNLWLEDAHGSSAWFIDNNFDMLPGEQKIIDVKTEKKSIDIKWWTLNNILQN
ncbi:MAG: glycoside hydrolase family 2 protein [Bacteroidales bacterium]|nr:glycoside hydrolase family 2 protein [Bacteroidales bacterium]